MFICMVDNDYVITKHEYLGEDNDNNIVCWLTPQLAKVFKTKKAAEKWIEANVGKPEPSSIKIVDPTPHYEKYDALIKGGMIYRKFQKKDIVYDRPYDKQNDTPLDVLNWTIYVKNERNNVSYKNYQTWPTLWELYKNIWSVGMYRSRDYTKSWIGFEMAVRPNSDFATFEKELNLVTKYNEWKHDDLNMVKIFDHFLSEHGNSMCFCWDFDKQIFKMYRNSYTYREEQSFTTLQEAFYWWKANRYYD